MIKKVYKNKRGSNTEAMCFIDGKAHTYKIQDHIDGKTAFCTNPSESKWLTPSKRGYKDGKFMVANPVGASKPFRDVGDKKLKESVLHHPPSILGHLTDMIFIITKEIQVIAVIIRYRTYRMT